LHHECSPGRGASCRGGRCRCQCLRRKACQVRERRGNLRRVTAVAWCPNHWRCSMRLFCSVWPDANDKLKETGGDPMSTQ
jgi:hypothetical protein